MTTPHAVRWIIGIRRGLGNDRVYTRWHYTDNATWTRCERMIKLMDEYDHKLPESDDDLSRVDCRLCLKRKAK